MAEGWCTGGDEPLSATVDPNVAATKIAAVAALIRLSVNRSLMLCLSHDLAPLAPAIAAIAHAAHMERKLPPLPKRTTLTGHALSSEGNVVTRA